MAAELDEAMLLVLSVLDPGCRDGGPNMDAAKWGTLPDDVLLQVVQLLPLPTALVFEPISKQLYTYLRSAEFIRKHALIEGAQGLATVCAVARRSLLGQGPREMDLSFLPGRYRNAFRRCDLSPTSRTRWCGRSSTFAAATSDGYVVVAEAGPAQGPVIPLHLCVFSPLSQTFRELPVINLTAGPAETVRLQWTVQVAATEDGGFKVFSIHHHHREPVVASVFRSDVNRWTAGRSSALFRHDFNLTRRRMDTPHQVVCTASDIYHLKSGLLSAYHMVVTTEQPPSSTWRFKCTASPRVCQHHGTPYVVLTTDQSVEIQKQRRTGIWRTVWESVCTTPLEKLPVVQRDFLDIQGLSVAGDMICMLIRLRDEPDEARGRAAGPVVHEWLCYHLVKGFWVSGKVASHTGNAPAFLFDFRHHRL